MVYEYIADFYMWIYKKCMRNKIKEEKLYTLNEVMYILNKNFIKYAQED